MLEAPWLYVNVRLTENMTAIILESQDLKNSTLNNNGTNAKDNVL